MQLRKKQTKKTKQNKTKQNKKKKRPDKMPPKVIKLLANIELRVTNVINNERFPISVYIYVQRKLELISCFDKVN